MRETVRRMNQHDDFDWLPCPEASQRVWGHVERWIVTLPFAAELSDRMLRETGTRFCDWIDHLALPDGEPLVADLLQLGYQSDDSESPSVYRHSLAMLPTIRIVDGPVGVICLRVDDVADFACAHHVDADIDGTVGAQTRRLRVAQNEHLALDVIERHGDPGFLARELSPKKVVASLRHAEAFRRRKRDFEDDLAGFQRARQLIQDGIQDLGVDWACDLFFAAERQYWQSRNRAARVQKRRQDRLGLGWGNHDHHTYRCSRQNFAPLIEVLELLGFHCRERFYGGAEAGWGAQVLEQANAGIVIFADVDLSVSEVTGDFAHEGLPAREDLGTVGLWCTLHGEAFLQAGMHHLECQFDFHAARDQLAELGIPSMKPFTDFDYLKQSFTEGETWQIASRRIRAAVRRGVIDEEQASRFREQGSVGSHLEILQRDDGYKGFNQTGISEIIRATDPRRMST